MVGVLGPYTWTGGGLSDFGGGYRPLKVAVHVETLPPGADIRGPVVPSWREIGAWCFRDFVNTAFGLPDADMFDAWKWVEQEEQVWEFAPDPDTGFRTGVKYSVYPGGELWALVFVA